MQFSERYARQIVIDGFGSIKQKKLAKGRVLVVGLGGLGNPAAQYLAAAGIGTIGLIDDDVITASNFNRQFLYYPQDLDKIKVQVAQEKLSRFNPKIKIRAFNLRLHGDLASDIFEQFDIVLDCLDNLEARILVNQACVNAGIPLVHGGVIRFYGQLTTIIPFKGPCLRCFAPGSMLDSNVEEMGIIGPASGVIGVLQAMEAVKYLSGAGEGLVGRLLVFDGLQGAFEEVQIERNPRCPVCGSHNNLNM